MKKGGITRHVLCEIKWPQKQTHTSTDLITFHNGKPDKSHTSNTVCNLNLRQNQRALITKISVQYTHNDVDKQIFVDIGPIFFTDTLPENFESSHPDKSSMVRFLCAGATWNGVTDPNARVIYSPNHSNLKVNLFQYAGFEDAIMNERTTIITPAGIVPHGRFGYESYAINEPLLMFLLEHQKDMKEMRATDIRQHGEGTYLVKSELVEQVQEFFREHVYPQLRYTTVNSLPIKVHFPLEDEGEMPETFALLISVDYITISHHSTGALKVSETELKL